jgi:hypothetical protein
MLVHKFYPRVEKTQYRANENIDFELKFPGRQLRQQKLHLNGTFIIRKADNSHNDDEEVLIDPQAGIASLFTNVSVTWENVGQIETINHYPVVSKMATWATSNHDDIVGQLNLNMELKASTAEQILAINQDHTGGVPFSHRVLCSVNATNGPIPSNKSGMGILSIRTRPNEEVLYGAGFNGHYYELTDLHITVESEPLNSEMAKAPVAMKLRECTQIKLESSRINIQLNTPVNCIGFAGVFVPDGHLTTAKLNSLDLTSPNITNVSYHFNDTSGLVSYPMDTRQEILYNALSMFGDMKERNLFNESLDKALIGLAFPSVALQERKLTINLEFDAPANHSLYIMFMGIATV